LKRKLAGKIRYKRYRGKRVIVSCILGGGGVEGILQKRRPGATAGLLEFLYFEKDWGKAGQKKMGRSAKGSLSITGSP